MFYVSNSLVVRLGLLDPERVVRITDELEEPPKQAEAIAAYQAEPLCVRGEGVCERARIVVDVSKRLRDDLRHGFGILALVEEVRRDPRWTRDRQSSQHDPFSVGQRTRMEPHVPMARLTSPTYRELMDVRRQVTDAIHLRGGPMRHDAVDRIALPNEYGGRELQPRGTKVEMIWVWRPDELVDAISDAPKLAAGSNEAIPCSRRDPDVACLLTCDEPPLVLGHRGDATSGGFSRHYCSIPRYRGLSQ